MTIGEEKHVGKSVIINKKAFIVRNNKQKNRYVIAVNFARFRVEKKAFLGALILYMANI
jgi:hypothetical protein